MSAGPMDDLWRALSSTVIGRNAGFPVWANESMTEAEISQDACELGKNCSKSIERCGK